MSDSGYSPQGQKTDKEANGKDRAGRFLWRTKTALASVVQAMCVMLEQNICLHFAPFLRLCRRGRWKTNSLGKEISRMTKVEVVAWVVLVVLGRSESQVQKAQHNDFKC